MKRRTGFKVHRNRGNPADVLASDEPLGQTHSLQRPYARTYLADGDLERPAFEYSEAQAAIGPFKLDPEDPGIVIPKSINRFLRDYQRVGAAFLYRKYKQGHGGVLGDDMGLGKTIQVISFVSIVSLSTIDRYTVVCHHAQDWNVDGLLATKNRNPPRFGERHTPSTVAHGSNRMPQIPSFQCEWHSVWQS